MKVSVLRGAAAFGLIVLLYPFLQDDPAFAQNRLTRPIVDQSDVSPIQQLQRRLHQSDLATALAFEGPVDPEEYIVGPGDIFVLTISGTAPRELLIPVGPDGTMDLPDGGDVAAADRTLSVVLVECRDALAGAYEAFEVSLLQPRRFYVHVSGSVPEPGRYLTLPSSRIDDALQHAFAAEQFERPDPESGNEPRVVGSATAQRPSMHDSFRPSLRNVTLSRRDGTTRSLDLMDYYVTGSLDNNPYLLDGDVLTVPSFHVVRDAYRVEGEVPYAGIFDFRPGDTVLDALRLAAGEEGYEQIETVRLTRGTETGVETRDIDLATNGSDSASSIALRPQDILNIVPVERPTVHVGGFVRYPGTYPIANGVTTLREAVRLAGGPRPEASVRTAYLNRYASIALKADAAASDLDIFGRALLESSINTIRFSVSVDGVLSGRADDIALYDGDRIFFPRDEGTVFVAGNVTQPGYVDYVAGESAQFYVEMAGGAGAQTSGIYVFEPTSGQTRSGPGAEVKPGDTVFLNRSGLFESVEMAQLGLSQRNARRQTRILTIQTIISSLTTAVTIILALDRLRGE